MTWSPPWPTNRQPSLARISASVLGTALDETCPEYLAFKTHPGVYVTTDKFDRTRRDRYDTFTMGLIRTAILALAYPGAG